MTVLIIVICGLVVRLPLLGVVSSTESGGSPRGSPREQVGCGVRRGRAGLWTLYPTTHSDAARHSHERSARGSGDDRGPSIRFRRPLLASKDREVGSSP